MRNRAVSRRRSASVMSADSDQVLAYSDHGGLGTVVGPELGQQVRYVGLDCPLTDEQRLGDFLVGSARDEP